MSSLRSRLQSATGLAKSEAIAVTVISGVLLIGSLGPRLWPESPKVPSGRDLPALIDSLDVQHDEADAHRNSLHHSYRSNTSRRLDSIGDSHATVDDPTSIRRRSVGQSPKHAVPRGTRVNLNSASESRLVLIPGIGPATARAIVMRRAQRPFRSVDELLDIRGIGPRKLERMRPYVSAP